MVANYKTPKDIVVMTINAALIKASLRWERIMSFGFLAGAYIAIGGVLATIVTGGMEQQTGIEKLVAGAVFPVGLMCVLVAGGELYTGNTAIMTPSWIMGRITTRDLLRLARVTPTAYHINESSSDTGDISVVPNVQARNFRDRI